MKALGHGDLVCSLLSTAMPALFALQGTKKVVKIPPLMTEGSIVIVIIVQPSKFTPHMQKRILLINNETHFIEDLINALSQHKITIRDFQAVQPGYAEAFDCVILSGGGTAGEVADSKELYRNEIKIVRESSVPIFGICEGFQVIGAAYNSNFQILRAYRKGVNTIKILIDDPIFEGLKKLELRVFEYHHIAIDHIGEELISLGISEDGIEMMRHKNKLIYGSQFHPEELKDGNDGHTILKNFLKMV